MSSRISKTSVLHVQGDSFPKTRIFFDWLLYVINRVEEVVWAGKYLIFGCAFLLFLIYELAHFAKFLLRNWHGG